MSGTKAKAIYEQSLDSVEDFHTAPQILAQASIRIQDPNVEVDDIVDLLKADPALTADIIRISNSAFYSFETEASNLTDAMNRIGFGEIIRLIGISITKSLFADDLKHYNLSQEDYWANSICTALMMESFAMSIRMNPNDAYTVGLLHGVGKIVLDDILTKHRIKDTWNGIKDLTEWEKKVVGFTSAYAGAMILKRWGFPEKTCHPILYQLHPPKDKIKWALHTALYLSVYIVSKCEVGFKTTDVDLTEIIPILERMDIDPTKIPSMLSQNREAFVKIKQSFQAA